MTTVILLIWIAAELLALSKRGGRRRQCGRRVVANVLWFVWSIAFLGSGYHLGTPGRWTGYLWTAFVVLCIACGTFNLGDAYRTWRQAQRAEQVRWTA